MFLPAGSELRSWARTRATPAKATSGSRPAGAACSSQRSSCGRPSARNFGECKSATSRTSSRCRPTAITMKSATALPRTTPPAEQPGEIMPMYEPELEIYSPSLPAQDSEQSQEDEGQAVADALPAPSRDGSDSTQPSPTAAPAASTAAPGTPVAQLFENQEWRYRDLPLADPSRRQQLEEETAAQEPENKKPRLDMDEAVASALEAHQHSGPYLPLTYEEKFANPRDLFAQNVFRDRPWTTGQTRTWVTRKDQKALEKEIPRHLIPEEQQHLYEEARRKEWDTWKKFEAVKPLDQQASQWVEQNVDRGRILSTRFCYRNKNAAYPWLEVRAKARLVCRGDQDPDLLTLRRDAPTLTRIGLMIILQIAASFQEFFLFNSDITGAFLQGSQEAFQPEGTTFPEAARRRTARAFQGPAPFW